MAHLLRIVLALLLSVCAGLAVADGGAFPATPGQWDTSTCSPSSFPLPNWLSPSNAPNAAPSWSCMAAVGSSRLCGYSFREDAGGQGFAGMCDQQKGAESCPAGANMSTASDGSKVCTCTAGLRPSNGQCVALPACPEGQHEEGGACVPDACKPNETRVNGVCVPEPPCPAGQTRVNGKCQPFKCPSAGTVSDQWYDLTGPGRSSTCLYNHTDNSYCVMSITPSVIASSGGRPAYYGGYGVYTGGTCGPSEPGKPTPQDPDKPEGDPDRGTKPAGPNDPKPSDRPSGPGGPGNNPTPPGPNGDCPPGTYKSNGGCYPKDPPKLPPDNDGKCPAGYVKIGSECVPLMPPPDKGEGEEDDDKGSTFGGQCESVSCEGDAIQCAIARDQYRRSCEAFDKESPESSLYKSSKGKEGPQTGDLPGNATHSISSGMYDASNVLGAATCIPDLSIDVVGQSVSLPISQICSHLATLRLALLAFGALLWVIIVFRG